MTKLLATALVSAALLGGVATADARPVHHAKSMMTNASVVERDPAGRATMVLVDGTQYKVCSASVTDGCINPRQAGLNFGNTPLNYWPGQPASQTSD